MPDFGVKRLLTALPDLSTIMVITISQRDNFIGMEILDCIFVPNPL
jgi:hypothetical protein